MRKPDFCICLNKDADQLGGNREADQRLCFCYTDNTIPLVYILNPKFQASSHLLWLYSRFVSDKVGNPEDRFSHNEAHIFQDNSNKMFLMMDFKKTGTAKLPAADIKLDPCVYKKR